MANKRKWTEQQLTEAVKSSKSYREVLKKLGLKLSGGTQANIKIHVEKLNLDTNHFTGRGWCTGDFHKKLCQKLRIPTEEILVNNSTYTSTYRLKKRLVKENVLVDVCEICGIGPEWNGKHLSLQLDHKNGKRADNRLINLRIVCPNCHSQTESFAGKNKKKANSDGQQVSL